MAQGFQGVTMAKVAAQARVSLSTVYRLFPNKLQLFSAIIEKHRQSMIALPGDYDDLPIAIALEHIFRVDLDEETEKWRFDFISMVVSEAQRFPELIPVFLGRGPQQSRELLTGWLQRQHRAGRIHSPECDTAARMLMDVAFGIPVHEPNGLSDRKGGVARTQYLKSCFKIIAAGLKPCGTTGQKKAEVMAEGNE